MSHVTHSPDGTVTITDGALAQIVLQAAEAADAVRVRRRPRRHLDVTVRGDHARASVGLAVRYGEVLPEAARAVQDRVRESLERMCGVAVDSVDVTIEELSQ